jgi:hypothetical protein
MAASSSSRFAARCTSEGSLEGFLEGQHPHHDQDEEESLGKLGKEGGP